MNATDLRVKIKQIKVIEASTEHKRKDVRIGWYKVIVKSLEDNVNEFLATISEEKIISIDYKENICIIIYLKDDTKVKENKQN